MQNEIIAPFPTAEPHHGFSLFDLLFPPMPRHHEEHSEHGLHDRAYDNSAPMSFLDIFSMHMMFMLRGLTEFMTTILYVLRVEPVKSFNHMRSHFCDAFPDYGTDEFLMLANEHPLRIVFCSHWLSKRIRIIEEIIVAPYMFFKMAYNSLTEMLFPTPVEEIIVIDYVTVDTVEAVPCTEEAVQTVETETVEAVEPVEAV